jgi:hypothetical protein
MGGAACANAERSVSHGTLMQEDLCGCEFRLPVVVYTLHPVVMTDAVTQNVT